MFKIFKRSRLLKWLFYALFIFINLGFILFLFEFETEHFFYYAKFAALEYITPSSLIVDPLVHINAHIVKIEKHNSQNILKQNEIHTFLQAIVNQGLLKINDILLFYENFEETNKFDINYEILKYYNRKITNDYQNHLNRYQLKIIESNYNWKSLVNNWVQPNQVTTNNLQYLYGIMMNLRNENVKYANVFPKGTQLKLLLTLETDAQVIMKPKRYPRAQRFSGYTGADRHNSEIVTFYLNTLLGFNRSPLVTGRLINVTQLKSVAPSNLATTFYTNEIGEDCFYGICMYCKKSESICVPSDQLLEASVTMLLPPDVKLRTALNPWMRSYRENHLTWWEFEPRFCDIVRTNTHSSNNFNKLANLADLIDAAVLDFLVGNSDRHHVEFLSRGRMTPREFIVLLDNGKGFGTPEVDDITILAPLYQCCQLRHTTWIRLLNLASLAAFTTPEYQRHFSSKINFEQVYNYKNPSLYRAKNQKYSILGESRHLLDAINNINNYKDNNDTTNINMPTNTTSGNIKFISFGRLLQTILKHMEPSFEEDLLIPEYFQAIDRRLLKVITIGHYCLTQNLKSQGIRPQDLNEAFQSKQQNIIEHFKAIYKETFIEDS